MHLCTHRETLKMLEKLLYLIKKKKKGKKSYYFYIQYILS